MSAAGPGREPAGPTPLAAGRDAEVSDLGDGTVRKLFFDPASAPAAHREAATLRALEALDAPAPRLVEEVVVDGRPGIVMTRADGPDWIRALAARPWTCATIGRRLAHAHTAVHEVTAPASLPTTHEWLEARLSSSAHLDDGARSRALERLASLPGGTVLCHGDFHLENLVGPLDAPIVLDWVNATAGTPVSDVARTVVILRFGEAPESTPAIVRRLAPVARHLVRARYVAAYEHARPGSLERLDAWVAVHAAARMGETTDSEAGTIRRWLASNDARRDGH